MRFFRTTNATRNYKTRGHSFAFEPLTFGNGSWAGVLKLDDDLGIVLASYGPPVTEISESEYEELKKKSGKYSQHTGCQVPLNQQPDVRPSVHVVENLDDEIQMKNVSLVDAIVK